MAAATSSSADNPASSLGKSRGCLDAATAPCRRRRYRISAPPNPGTTGGVDASRRRSRQAVFEAIICDVPSAHIANLANTIADIYAAVEQHQAPQSLLTLRIKLREHPLPNPEEGAGEMEEPQAEEVDEPPAQRPRQRLKRERKGQEHQRAMRRQPRKLTKAEREALRTMPKGLSTRASQKQLIAFITNSMGMNAGSPAPARARKKEPPTRRQPGRCKYKPARGGGSEAKSETTSFVGTGEISRHGCREMLRNALSRLRPAAHGGV